MALAVNSEMPTNTGDGLDGTPGTFNGIPHTYSFTNTAGSLLVLLAGIGLPSAKGGSFTSASYGGNAMTQFSTIDPVSGTLGGQLAIYYLLSPPTGANTVSILINVDASASNTQLYSGCISFTGNDPTTPLINSTSNTGNSATAATTLAGVAAGDLSVALAGAGTSMSAQTQTLTWVNNLASSTAMGNGRASRSASTGSVAHSFTIAGTDSWAVLAAEIQASGASIAAPLTHFDPVPFMRR